MNLRIKALSLLLFVFLTGCKEAEIVGVWSGPVKDFNSSFVMSLFSDAKEELQGEQISVSDLNTQGYTKTFLVTLGDKKHSKEWIEKVLKKVEQRQAENNTSITVTFADENTGKDENEKELLKLLKELKEEKTGSISSEIVWGNSEVVVYTEKLSFMGMTNPYSKLDPTVYCKLKAPLTKELSGLVIKSPFTMITATDIPDEIRSKMTDSQIIDYIRENNSWRHFVNVSMQVYGNIYPHKSTFSDAFMNKLSQETNGILKSASHSYSLNTKNIEITYGSIPDAKFDPISGPLLGDMSGELHRKCSAMIAEMTPELDMKIKNAQKYASFGKLAINPKWKPES